MLCDIGVDRFPHAFDRTNPVGLSDYAVVRCLVDFGLRVDEINHLTLDALNWRSGIATLT